MKSDPQAATLFLLTIPNASEEHILFASTKKVHDIPTDDIYFYNKYGQGGDPKSIREGEIQVRQWFAIGKINHIDELWEKLITTGQAGIPRSKRTFIMPKVEQAPDSESTAGEMAYRVADYPLPSGTYKCYKYTEHKFFENIYLAASVQDLLRHLQLAEPNEMYSSEIFPRGIWSISELQEFLANRTCAVRESSLFLYDFHGEKTEVRNQRGMAPHNFVGFVRNSPIPREDVGILVTKDAIANPESILSGLSPVDTSTGLFTFQCAEPITKGYLYFIDMKQNSILAARRFTLITNINIQVVPMEQAFQDLFGESISTQSNKLEMTTRKTKPVYSFFREAIAGLDDRAYRKYLSSQIESIIQMLGGQIRIIDPYFLGPIGLDEDSPSLNDGAVVFLNAIMRICARQKLEELDFLCRKPYVREFQDRDTIPRQFALIKQAMDKIAKINIRIRFAKRSFHDRYWLATASNGNVLQISSSISSFGSSSELLITTVESEADRARILDRYRKLWDEAEEDQIKL